MPLTRNMESVLSGVSKVSTEPQTFTRLYYLFTSFTSQIHCVTHDHCTNLVTGKIKLFKHFLNRSNRTHVINPTIVQHFKTVLLIACKKFLKAGPQTPYVIVYGECGINALY